MQYAFDPYKNMRLSPGYVDTRGIRHNDQGFRHDGHVSREKPEDVTRVINALAYFANTQDLIPDDVPGLGYLDDAVMVDLVVRELASEIKAYTDFHKWRQEEAARRGGKGDDRPVTRMDWLAAQREKVQAERDSKGWLPWRRKSKSFLD